MNITPSKYKILTIQIIPIDVYKSDDQTFRLKVCLEVDAFYVRLEVNV